MKSKKVKRHAHGLLTWKRNSFSVTAWLNNPRSREGGILFLAAVSPYQIISNNKVCEENFVQFSAYTQRQAKTHNAQPWLRWSNLKTKMFWWTDEVHGYLNNTVPAHLQGSYTPLLWTVDMTTQHWADIFLISQKNKIQLKTPADHLNLHSKPRAL